MAKIPYSKLKLKTKLAIENIKINELNIMVKQYLPIQEKLKLISKVINLSHEEDYNYSNPIKIDIFTKIEIISFYTDISFTEKQLNDVAKLYDELYSNGIIEKIINLIPESEINIIEQGIKKSIASIYEYQNSALGILDSVKTDYDNLSINIEELGEQIGNINNLELLKNIVTKIE